MYMYQIRIFARLHALPGRAFPFVTATTGACACVRERVRVCVFLGPYSSRNQEHSRLKKRGAIQFFSFIFGTPSAVICAHVSHRKLLTL